MKLDRKDLLVYAVTDRYWLNGRSLEEDVEKAILGGASIIQLREKNISHKEFIDIALKVKNVCKKYNVPFIINDDVDVMLEVDADGIHVGQNDMVASKVREKIGKGKILGVSAETVEEAILAEKMGADYLGVGTIFTTSTKLDAIKVSISTLTEICDTVSIPVVAIGGITIDNVKNLKNTMIDGVAVVSQIFGSNDITNATKVLKQEVEKIVFNNPKYDLFIVDYDGTVIDSMEMWAHMFSSYVKSRGAEPEANLDEIAKTQNNYESTLYAQNKYFPNDSFEFLANDMNDFVEIQYVNQKTKKKAKDLLELFRKKGRVVLFSATSKNLLLASLKSCGILDLFDEVYSAGELGLSKTDGMCYQKICDLQNIDLSRTLVVEDAIHAIKSASLKGFDVLAISDYSNKNSMDEIRKYAKYFINLEKEVDYE